MSIKNYSLLKCRPLQYGIGSGHPGNGKPKRGGHPHFQVLVEGKRGQFHRIAINIISDDSKSSEADSLIRAKYFKTFVLEDLTTALSHESLTFGYHPLDSTPVSNALDFVRMKGLVRTSDMKKMPFLETGPDNDLQELVQNFIDEAINQERILFVFGQQWTDNKQVFFAEENGGIHDIHCNQGNPKDGGHVRDNGVWQDGGIISYHQQSSSWSAIFMAFDSQFTKTTIQTDERGNKLEESVDDSAVDIAVPKGGRKPHTPTPKKNLRSKTKTHRSNPNP